VAKAVRDRTASASSWTAAERMLRHISVTSVRHQRDMAT
jgi:hypothetical protein